MYSKYQRRQQFSSTSVLRVVPRFLGRRIAGTVLELMVRVVFRARVDVYVRNRAGMQRTYASYVPIYARFRDTWRSYLNFPWESYVSPTSRQPSIFSLSRSLRGDFSFFPSLLPTLSHLVSGFFLSRERCAIRTFAGIKDQTLRASNLRGLRDAH